MKSTLTAFAIALVFAACSSKQNTDAAGTPAVTNTPVTTDSSALDKNQVINMNGVSDTIVTSQGEFAKVKPGGVTTPKEPVEKEVTTTTTKHHHKKTTATSGSGTVASSTADGTETSTTATQPTVPKKKGWSNGAKGAVIGAGTGAVAGAIISKKKGTGAIIGGILGAGGGYIIGHSKDKKKAKAQTQTQNQ